MHIRFPIHRAGLALATAAAALLVLANPAAAAPIDTDGEFTDGTLTVSGGDLPAPIVVDLGNQTPLDPCSNDDPADSVVTLRVGDPVAGVYPTAVKDFYAKSFFQANLGSGSGTQYYRLDGDLYVNVLDPPDQTGQISGSDPYTVSQNVGLEATITQLSINNGVCSAAGPTCQIALEATLGGVFDEDPAISVLPALDGTATLSGGGTATVSGPCSAPIDNIDGATVSVTGLEVEFPA